MRKSILTRVASTPRAPDRIFPYDLTINEWGMVDDLARAIGTPVREMALVWALCFALGVNMSDSPDDRADQLAIKLKDFEAKNEEMAKSTCRPLQDVRVESFSLAVRLALHAAIECAMMRNNKLN